MPSLSLQLDPALKRATCAAFASRPPAGPAHPSPRIAHALPSTRQYASAFNQPLSLDTSSVTDMSHMFKVPRGPWPPTSWSNAPNDQQCGLYENGVPGDQQGVLCEIGARNEASATKEAFEVTCPVSRHLALAVALT